MLMRLLSDTFISPRIFGIFGILRQCGNGEEIPLIIHTTMSPTLEYWLLSHLICCKWFQQNAVNQLLCISEILLALGHLSIRIRFPGLRINGPDTPRKVVRLEGKAGTGSVRRIKGKVAFGVSLLDLHIHQHTWQLGKWLTVLSLPENSSHALLPPPSSFQ